MRRVRRDYSQGLKLKAIRSAGLKKECEATGIVSFLNCSALILMRQSAISPNLMKPDSNLGVV